MNTPIKVRLYLQEDKLRIEQFYAEKYGWDTQLKWQGMTGTLVYATNTAYGGYQITVELDEPHPTFGNFLRCGYMFCDRRDVLAEITSDHTRVDVARFAHFCQWSGWNRMHTKSGDPVTWERVEEIMERHQELYQKYLDRETP